MKGVIKSVPSPDRAAAVPIAHEDVLLLSPSSRRDHSDDQLSQKYPNGHCARCLPLSTVLSGGRIARHRGKSHWTLSPWR